VIAIPSNGPALTILEFETIDWHKLSPKDVQKRLTVDTTQGLSSQDAQERLRKHGKNKISPLPNPWLWKILGYFFKGFGSILFVGGILVFVSWKPLGHPPALANLALGIVLIAVFVIQAAFNGWQDWSSSRVMQSITEMLPESCNIIRDNKRIQVSAADIVPGDIILIKAGNRIPGDVRFLEVSHDTSVDRAVLTGKSITYSCSSTGQATYTVASLQENRSPSKQLSSRRMITISRPAASGFKVLTVCLEAQYAW